MSSETFKPFKNRSNQVMIVPKKHQHITHSNLVLFAFATAFFSRVLAGLGVPPAINFLHFIVVPLVCIYVLQTTKFRDSKHLEIVNGILTGLCLLFAVLISSALFNGAGLINVFLDFMLLGEPFMLLIAVICIPMSEESLEKFRKNWIKFSFINLLFAISQFLILRMDVQNADLIKGVFIEQASGHVVGASVSLTFAIYYFVIAEKKPLLIRSILLIATFVHIVKADAKQVLAVFLGALIILIFMKAKNFIKLLQYFAVAITFLALIILLANTVFRSLLIWADLDVQRQGMELKLSGFSILPEFYKSPLNWLLGLGPGHTIGRLGGWMVWEYKSLLSPLGLTTSQASVAVWSATEASWLGNKSSWFSPLFGWAGIWGDLGFLGLGAYLSLWWIVWFRICIDDLSKFFTLTVMLYGTIMSQIEEPGYMLYMTGIIALCWQTQQMRKVAQLAH